MYLHNLISNGQGPSGDNVYVYNYGVICLLRNLNTKPITGITVYSGTSLPLVSLLFKINPGLPSYFLYLHFKYWFS